MANILFLGTCSGTEPIAGMHHSSMVIEINGLYYWFDAGENCSRIASEMGVNLLKVKSIFISHTHMDHVGGLGNLLWNIRKLTGPGKGFPPEKKVPVFIPNMDSWNGIMSVLKNSEGNFVCDFEVVAEKPSDAMIYADENIKVYGVHNGHLPATADGKYLSYSYVIEAEGKKIVYSGDLGGLSDLEESVEDGCDILICETGHHKVDDVCCFAERKQIPILLFTHNGREIINDRQKAEKRLLESHCQAHICYDRMIFDISRNYVAESRE